MKFSNVIVRTSLIVAVVLSLVLSFIIWTNNQYFDNHTNDTKNVAVTKETNTVINNTYLPTEALYNADKSQTVQIYDKTRNVPLELSKKLSKIKLSALKIVVGSKGRYEDLLHDTKYIQLVYPDKVTVGTIANVSKINGKIRLASRKVNRIFIPVSGKGKIFFGEDEQRALLSTDISKTPINGIMQIIKTADQKINVSLHMIGSQYCAFYEAGTKIGVYSYLTSNQTESYYVSRLLGVSNVESKENEGIATYSSGPYQKIIVDRSKNIFSYNNYDDNIVPKNSTQLFSRSSQYLEKSGLTLNEMRYFENNDNQISYRYFVEGLPVFLEADNSAAINIDYTNGGTNLSFKNIIFQIPIPMDGREKAIQSTAKLLKEIEAKGVQRDDIQRIELGFKVVHDQENEKLVDLEPTMYFKIFNQWKDTDSWLESDIALAKRTLSGVK